MRINGATIIEPKSFDIDVQKISRTERTASGRLVEDIVAIKRTFQLKYNGLFRTEIQPFIDAQNLVESSTFEYQDGDVERTVKVRIGSIPMSPYWKTPTASQNITITLEEV